MIHRIIHNLAHNATAVPKYLDGQVTEVVDIAAAPSGHYRFVSTVIVVEEVRRDEDSRTYAELSRIYMWAIGKNKDGKWYVLASENFPPAANWAGKVYELFSVFCADRIVSPNANMALALQLMFSSIPPARISTSLIIT